METVLTAVKYLVFGFFGLIGVLFVLALLFGKRVRKQWEYEAEFRDADGREFGEFDIELSRIEKVEPDFRFKAKLRLRHASLKPHDTVAVLVDGREILKGMVEQAGRVFLGNEHIQQELAEPRVGLACEILVGSTVLATAPLELD